MCPAVPRLHRFLLLLLLLLVLTARLLLLVLLALVLAIPVMHYLCHAAVALSCHQVAATVKFGAPAPAAVTLPVLGRPCGTTSNLLVYTYCCFTPMLLLFLLVLVIT